MNMVVGTRTSTPKACAIHIPISDSSGRCMAPPLQAGEGADLALPLLVHLGREPKPNWLRLHTCKKKGQRFRAALFFPLRAVSELLQVPRLPEVLPAWARRLPRGSFH